MCINVLTKIKTNIHIYITHLLTDPVNFGITSDSLVEGINKDELEIYIGGILSHPVAGEKMVTT